MSLSVKILGSNAASFAHNRHHTSQVVQVQNRLFMIDCGEGTQLRCKKFNIKISRIDHILISHLHGDHYLGLMGLLSTMHLYGREHELILIGPPGLSDIISLQLRYSETTFNFPITFIEWRPNEVMQVWENAQLTIETIPLDHRVPCSGYLIREKPKKRRINKLLLPDTLTPIDMLKLRDGEDLIDEEGKIRFRNEDVTMAPNPSYSYAYCSDTRYIPDLAKQLHGVDMLYHEATFADDMKERAFQTFHSTARQAATLAKEAKIKKLLLGHFSTRYRELDPIFNEAREVFESSFLAIEGETFTV